MGNTKNGLGPVVAGGASGASGEGTGVIQSISRESRRFPPPPAFTARALINDQAEYDRLYQKSITEPEAFWADMATKELVWSKPWTKVLDWKLPWARWFDGGELNLSANCLDRHLAKRGDKVAILWEGEPGDERRITYKELHSEVCRAANVLKGLGIGPGDKVAIYMPMIPEAAVAMLACTRVGAAHTVVFGGFSAEALRDRINDCGAKLCITADGGYRRGKIVPLKANVDQALKQTPTIKSCLVVKRTGEAVHIEGGRDVWWHDLVPTASAECPPASLPSEHPLFILYTSGTTGKPKGIVHTTGGYLLGAHLTTKYIFDLHEEDVFWCTADIGWVTGHSYVVYGPLSNGATTVMYEGAPDHPDKDRFWSIIARRKVSIFYTAPTAIRAFVRWGVEYPNKHNMSHLRLLGSVGEPINPEAWMWYQEVIGGGRCPIVDTWWQTETGAIMMSPVPGITATKPGSCTRPFFGVLPEVVKRDGTPCKANEGGFLVLKQPWPSMLRGIHGDPDRYVKGYWSEIPGVYFTGDGARCDEDGYFWVMGRVDDVLNVAGHRLGTAEIESALVSYAGVAEAAVVGPPHELKGQAIFAFVTLKAGETPSNELKKRLIDHVAKEIGALARPDEIRFSDALPKTRSGKIMRRLLKEIATSGVAKGDTTTLEDLGVLSRLAASREDEE
ncbi:MAG TPA: acetate--CoA ligase [Polyangia bacterium]|jgi:acetyl-CoA synthetase|nr:acetate--CoA ligase [Polyangia bacterium]